MKLKVFAVHDAKTGGYMHPFFQPHVGMAVRMFQNGCNDPDHPFYRYPEDFTLYEISEYDEEKGQFYDLSIPEKLAHAKELKGTIGPINTTPGKAQLSQGEHT